MKIIHLSPFNPLENQSNKGAGKGGVGYAVEALIYGIKKHKILQDTISLHNLTPENEIKDTHQKALALQNQVLKQNIELFNKCKNSINGEQNNILLHTHDTLTCLAAGMLKNEYPLIPMILTLYDTVWGRTGGNLKLNSLFYHHLQEFALLRTNVITVPSQSVADECMECWPFLKPRIRIIPYAVDWRFITNEKFSGEFINSSVKKKSNYILFIGRLVSEKGVREAIECLGIVQDNGFGVKLKIAGSGHQLHDLQKLARDNHITDSVEFLGAVYGEKKKSLIENALCQIIPSHYEPFGIVTLEAMICNTTVVVFPTGGLKEIVKDQVTGLITRDCTKESLAEELCKILGSPELSIKLAKEARKRCINHYSPHQVALRYISIYKTLVPNKICQGD